MIFAEAVISEEQSAEITDLLNTLFVLFLFGSFALTFLFTWIGKKIAKRETNKAMQPSRFNDSATVYLVNLGILFTFVGLCWLTGFWSGFWFTLILPPIFIYTGYSFSISE